MNIQTGKKGRKVGTGSVVVNGKVMTTDMYKNAVLKTLTTTGRWMTTPEIIAFASSMKWCEPDDWTKRKACAHPIYKCISLIMDEQTFLPIVRMKDDYGKWTYHIKEPNAMYFRGELVKVIRKTKVNSNCA